MENVQIIQVLRKSEAALEKEPISIDAFILSKYSLLRGIHILPATKK